MPFHAVNPATGEALEPPFHAATPADVDRAAALAAEAAPVLADLPGADTARFLRAIASRLDAAKDALAARAHAETALPLPRCTGEIGRTSGQLRLFADLVERGDWVDARIETAQPDRTPAPKPDHRSMRRALGPVAVFGASNFPFAFSVAGGDTASALAAGCPVVAKAHPAHPGTSALVAALVAEAVEACGLPEGTFALLFDDGHTVGSRLVQHPAIRAVGFTGSHRGGRALMDLAAARPVPIPVYAEMSSLNPVFVAESALADGVEALADGFAGSCTLGVGQFCTNPGLVVLTKMPQAERFVAAVVDRLAAVPAAPMLTAGIAEAYADGVADRAGRLDVLRRGPDATSPALFATDLATFAADPSLRDELFGPASLVVWVECDEAFETVLDALDGSLTATLHAAPDDLPRHRSLLARLADRAGRVIVNQFPTGVEVSHAMVHGGPYPALSDGRTTSVGTAAIERFTRLVCYQNLPDALLPPALQNANPLGLLRLVDGTPTTDAV